jgi:hypothetical protein
LCRTVLAAPESNVAVDMPDLIAMAKSAHIDDAGFDRALAQSTQAEVAKTEAGLSHYAQVSSQAIAQVGAQERYASGQATAAFCDNIGFRSVVATTINGVPYHGRVSDDFAQTLVNEDPADFRVVPLNEYVKGVDF